MTKDDPVICGEVVFLNSDVPGNHPMTIGGSDERGRMLCRWHDDLGCIQVEWFYPEELYVIPEDDEMEVVFTPEAE